MNKILTISSVVLSVFLGHLSYAGYHDRSLVQTCYDAALATSYVYEDQYQVSVDTNVIDQFQTEVMWVEMNKPHFQMVQIPEAYKSGGYVFNKGTQTFYLKGNLSSSLPLEASLKILNGLSAVVVGCRYRI